MNIYAQQPPVAATTKTLRGYVTYICLEPRKLTKAERKANEIPDKELDENGNEIKKEAWTAHVAVYRHDEPLTEADYGPIVSAIIRSRYTADDVEAIINNYVAEQNEEHSREFESLQSWRATAKTAARIAVGK